MNITVIIQKGPHKLNCDDAALIGNEVYDEGVHRIQPEMPCIVAVADGVGGNQGGKEASRFVLCFLGDVADIANQPAENLQALLQNCNTALLS